MPPNGRLRPKEIRADDSCPGLAWYRPLMVLLLNGAFGIGKTTVSRLLVARSPRAVVFDPEWMGIL
jgi:hypothetical protein